MKAHKSTQPCSHVSFFLRNDPGDIQEFAMHWGRRMRWCWRAWFAQMRQTQVIAFSSPVYTVS